MFDTRRVALHAVALALIVGAALALVRFWAPLVLAAWVADLLAPVVRRSNLTLGGRRRGAAAVVVLLVLFVLGPLVALAFALASGIRELAANVRAALQGRESFATVLVDGGAQTSPRDWLHLATRDLSSAWRTALAVLQASTWLFLSVVVFLLALFELAARGAHDYRWLARNAPIPRHAFTRLARAFRETGRGLLVGIGGTALVQGAVATIAYLAIGVPRAWLLGPLTALAALVPMLGTALVWVPLAIELSLTGHWGRGLAVAIVGALVIGLIDNFVRPLLTRFGKLELPVLVLLVSMLGGIAAFGPSGVLLGPLLVRMAVEALELLRSHVTRT